MFRFSLAAAVAAFAFFGVAHAEIRISIDTSLADRTLALLCSGERVNERAIRRSAQVQAQIEHNQGLTAAATIDAYIAALRAASACAAPSEDPFGIADVIANADTYRAKINGIRARQDVLAASVAARLAPYVPADFSFAGGVVLAVPYFSCGGFSTQGAFFIDVRCLSTNIEEDALALELLVAHETFHAIQAATFHPIFEGEAQTTAQAYQKLLDALLIEGTAEFVAPSRELLNTTGGGMLTRIGREYSFTNGQRRRSNTSTLGVLFEYVGAHPEAPEAAANRAYTIAFTGTYQQFAYYVGAEIAGAIQQAWGAPGLLCVMRMPSEEFVRAYGALAAVDANLRALDPAILRAAEEVRATRPAAADFNTCRPA